MKHTVRTAAGLGLALGLALAASPLHAQNPGLPVYNHGIPRGVGLYGDVGFPNDAAGSGTAYGATVRAGLGLFGATATLSALNPDGPAGSDVAVGGTLNYRLLGGPLVPFSVTLQGGVSYAKPGDNAIALPARAIARPSGRAAFSAVPDLGPTTGEITLYHFPIGVGLSLVIPNPVLAIQPWLAPRVDIVRASAGGASDTETNFGLSGGLELNLLNGFGIQAAYDRVFLSDGADPGTFGLGAHYTFRVPGL
ncbi:MAG TPA: outer membrane beta-barrel protein [Gemmatimonadales bacterium]|jgi:opacity protein-like surface antigen|nr:outer membrane beta-barrel protein [Gemmatimonadales bacterium]